MMAQQLSFLEPTEASSLPTSQRPPRPRVVVVAAVVVVVAVMMMAAAEAVECVVVPLRTCSAAASRQAVHQVHRMLLTRLLRHYRKDGQMCRVGAGLVATESVAKPRVAAASTRQAFRRLRP